MKTITATDRKALIRLASTLPKGSDERKAILAGLKLAVRVRIPGENPWAQGPEVDVSDSLVKRLVKAALASAEETSAKKPKVSYAYDRPMQQALKSILPKWGEDGMELFAAVKALHQALEKQVGRDDDWYAPSRAAARTIGTRLAYMTPGFAKALRDSEGT